MSWSVQGSASVSRYIIYQDVYSTQVRGYHLNKHLILNEGKHFLISVSSEQVENYLTESRERS